MPVIAKNLPTMISDGRLYEALEAIKLTEGLFRPGDTGSPRDGDPCCNWAEDASRKGVRPTKPCWCRLTEVIQPGAVS